METGHPLAALGKEWQTTKLPGRILKLPIPPLPLQALIAGQSALSSDASLSLELSSTQLSLCKPIAEKEKPQLEPLQCSKANTERDHRQPVRWSRRWTPQEEAQLERLVSSNQDSPSRSIDWKWVAANLSGIGRTAHQCRQRWEQQLRPGLNRDPWTAEEDARLLQLRSEVGNAWASMIVQFPGRSYNQLKNRWYGSIRFKSLEGPARHSVEARTKRLSTRQAPS